jgi:hypothetical protein
MKAATPQRVPPVNLSREVQRKNHSALQEDKSLLIMVQFFPKSKFLT